MKPHASSPAQISFPMLVLALGLEFGGLLAVGGCQRQAPAPAPAPAVMVLALPIHAQQGSGGEALRFPAEVAPRYANVMSFRVAGKLLERDVRLGDVVHHG